MDEEEEFKSLCDSLNSRGVREKRLLEALRKLAPSLKLRKARQKNTSEVEVKTPEVQKESASDVP